MNKGIYAFIVLLALSSTIFPMDWNDLNDLDLDVDASVGFEDPEVLDLFNGVLCNENNTTQIKNDAPEHYDLSASENELAEEITTENQLVKPLCQRTTTSIRKWDILCQLPTCNQIIHGSSRMLSTTKDRYVNHIICHAIDCNETLKDKINSLSTENKSPCYFNDCKVLVNKDTIISHLALCHLKEILEQSTILTKERVDTYLQKRQEEILHTIKEQKLNSTSPLNNSKECTTPGVVIPGFSSNIEKHCCIQYNPQKNNPQKRVVKYSIPCQLPGCDTILHGGSRYLSGIKNDYVHHIIRHVINTTQLHNEISKFVKSNDDRGCVIESSCKELHGCKILRKIHSHLAFCHWEDILEQYSSLVTLDEVKNYLQEKGIIKRKQAKAIKTSNKRKRKVAFDENGFLNNDGRLPSGHNVEIIGPLISTTNETQEKVRKNKNKRTITCQLCGDKGISASPGQVPSLIKRKYVSHLMQDIVNHDNRLKRKDKVKCSLCGEVVEKRNKLSGRLYQHLVVKHLETILEQSEQLCGKKITKEQIDHYLKEHGIVVDVSKNNKRKLDDMPAQENDNDEVLPPVKEQDQSEIFTDVDQFVNAINEKCSDSKGTLSIEEIEKHLGI